MFTILSNIVLRLAERSISTIAQWNPEEQFTNTKALHDFKSFVAGLTPTLQLFSFAIEH
jgi:hypothetical protein